MNEYRTPEEEQQQTEDYARIRAILDQVVHAGASCKVAMVLGESPEVVERWVNVVWDGMRDNLTDRRDGPGTLTGEDRLTAILMLLEDRMTDEAVSILRGMREVGDA